MKMNKEQFLKTENAGMVSGTVGSVPDGDQTLLRSGISLYQNG